MNYLVLDGAVNVRMEAQRQEPVDEPLSLRDEERVVSLRWLAREIDRAVTMVEGRFVG
jgi:hypothetical protein